MWPTQVKEWRNRLQDSTSANEARGEELVAIFPFISYNLNSLLPLSPHPQRRHIH